MVREAVDARRHGNAGRQPFDIPFEWSGKRFVKVIEIEHRLAVRTVEPPEISQVGVAAQFDPEIGAWSRREVTGLDRGRAAQIGEGAVTHPSEPERNELLDPILVQVLFLQDRQRINPLGTDGCFRMRLEWYRVAPRPAFVIPVAQRRTKVCQVRIEAFEFNVHVSITSSVRVMISPAVRKT